MRPCKSLLLVFCFQALHCTIFLIFVFNICIYLGNWGVKGAMCKILEFFDQNCQRHNLSQLATFDPIFQLPHSALAVWFLVIHWIISRSTFPPVIWLMCSLSLLIQSVPEISFSKVLPMLTARSQMPATAWWLKSVQWFLLENDNRTGFRWRFRDIRRRKNHSAFKLNLYGT